MIAKVQVDYNLHFFFFSQYAPEFPASKPVSDHIGSNSILQPGAVPAEHFHENSCNIVYTSTDH